ncbi:MAG: ATP-binding protein [bacterium]
MARQIVLTWSGGKDSVMALDFLMGTKDWDVVGLLTTVTLPYNRVSMHGVRRQLLLEQANSLGLPLEIIWLGAEDPNETYERKMAEKLREFWAKGVRHVAFGDIFLESLRTYREENLARVGMEGFFPLWGKDTSQAVRELSSRGFKAIITCVDTQFLDGSFLGKEVNEDLLALLPQGVDPCGENGEFHSFVYGGPLFTKQIGFQKGTVVEREGGRFLFLDLIPLK